MIRAGVLIPTLNNGTTIGQVLDELQPFELPCIVVDDGSNEEHRVIYQREAALRSWVHLIRQTPNQGKGAAFAKGMAVAEQMNWTHAIQIDGDGQHHSADIPRFLAEAEAHPNALILGKPVFGEDVPKARLHGRKLSVALVWLETLSLSIGDPLFGFRCYPVAASRRVLTRSKVGRRMDFDPDMAVRLFWQGTPMRNVPTPVRYPEGGVSHFKMVRDNLRMIWLHTRLIPGALVRLPILLWRKWQQ